MKVALMILLGGISLTNAIAVEGHLTQETAIPIVDAQGHETGATMKVVAGESVQVLNLNPNTGLATIVYGSSTLTVPIAHLDADAVKAPHIAVSVNATPVKLAAGLNDEEQVQSLLQPGKVITFYRNPGVTETKESFPIDKATAQGTTFHIEYGGKSANGRYEKRMILKFPDGDKIVSLALFPLPTGGGWQSWGYTAKRSRPVEAEITESKNPVAASTPSPTPTATPTPMPVAVATPAPTATATPNIEAPSPSPAPTAKNITLGTGVLKEGIALPLLMDGKQVGSIKIAAGETVQTDGIIAADGTVAIQRGNVSGRIAASSIELPVTPAATPTPLPVAIATPTPTPAVPATQPIVVETTISSAVSGKPISATELKTLLETKESKVALLPGPVSVSKELPPRKLYKSRVNGEVLSETIIAYWRLNPKADYRIILGGDIKEIWSAGNKLSFRAENGSAVCDIPKVLYADGNIAMTVTHQGGNNLGSMHFESTDPTPILPITYSITDEPIKATEQVGPGFVNSFTWDRTVLSPGQFVYLNVPAPTKDKGNLKTAVSSLLAFHDPSYTEAASDLFTPKSNWGRDEMLEMAHHFRDIGFYVEDTTTTSKTQADKQRLVESIKSKLEDKNPVLICIGGQWKLIVGFNTEDSTFFIQTPQPSQSGTKQTGMPSNVQKIPAVSLATIAQAIEVPWRTTLCNTKETDQGFTSIAKGMPRYLKAWPSSDGKSKSIGLHDTLKRLQTLKDSGQAIMIPSGGHILLIPKQQTTGDNVKAQIVPEGTNVTISLKDAADIIDAHQGIFFSPREI